MRESPHLFKWIESVYHCLRDGLLNLLFYCSFIRLIQSGMIVLYALVEGSIQFGGQRIIQSCPSSACRLGAGGTVHHENHHDAELGWCWHLRSDLVEARINLHRSRNRRES